ncbi:GntR family transcriptional regulator [Catenovulum agarivorans DS-2]|uniref:GntR family transcriptional regulator n=1 Tax=Catenovulum agarivorans DS-2 TaxID=1328313 RepID=W7QEX4_9ALTE|nr:FadR/GntR family transcriptional regulator [Catenovulum agarivorans]EWH10476.1 GntR family transcriptional regulator [Catenovulum agarivorans DS-2]
MSKFDAFKVITTERLYIKVAGQLKELIEQGVFKPGERFPAERALAEKLGVSRPTIREAMIALELAGLIEIRTGSGIYVATAPVKKDLDASDDEIGPFENLEMRYILESEMCAIAAQRISDEQLDRLEAALIKMENSKDSPSACEEADSEFHLIIAEATQNTAMYKTVKWLWEARNQAYRSTAFFEKIRQEGIHPSIEAHRKIYQALANRDSERARLAMKNHIDGATENAAKHFED